MRPTTLLPLVLLTAASHAWQFIVYPDSECESAPSGVLEGEGNTECRSVPANHRSLEIHDLGGCLLYLYATMEDCLQSNFPSESYDNGEEDECIAADFQWDAYRLWLC
jgi:hypothetical protein